MGEARLDADELDRFQRLYETMGEATPGLEHPVSIPELAFLGAMNFAFPAVLAQLRRCGDLVAACRAAVENCERCHGDGMGNTPCVEEWDDRGKCPCCGPARAVLKEVDAV